MKLYYHILVNQASGSGRGKKVAEKIQLLVERHQLPHRFYYTEYAGQELEITHELMTDTLIEWQEEYREDSDCIFPLLVVIGGDGVFHQVINQIQLEGKQLPIAYIAAGSGNDFARSIPLPKEPEKAFWQIAQATMPRSINILLYDEKIQEEQGVVVNNLGIGLDAAIVHATNHSSRKASLNKYNLGSFSYISSIASLLFRQKGFPVLIEYNGKQLNFNKAFLCTTTNHPYFGGGVAIAPMADVRQEAIDLVLVERISMFKIFWLILLLVQKKQAKSRYFHHIQTNKLRIVSTVPQYGQEDGEEMGKRPFDIVFTTSSQQIWC